MRSARGRREVLLSPDELQNELRRRSRRGFLTAGLAAVAGVGAYEWLTGAGQEDGVPWPQRRMLSLDETLAHAYLSNDHYMPTYSAGDITYLKSNGEYGLGKDWDLSTWQLKLVAEGVAPLTLSLADVQKLPSIDMITRFCCIEGWSVITSWTGVRFSDFTRKFYPLGRALTPYVSLATPDDEYYVGLDTKSAMHPQTLLAYAHNGKPLNSDHGAPLRLVIPVKYGIKNIKRIGSIHYTTRRPDDYWAEQGYDWFAGL